MKTLFLDTNVLLQCCSLEQLPWYEISKDEDIVLLICRPVQEEIDLLKNDGNSRRAKRSRSATTLFRNILASEISKIVIRNSGPHVEVTFAPTSPLKESPFPFLDLSRIDDRIIIETIYYRDQHPKENVALLTNDTQPIVTSRDCKLACIIVPDTWLLPPEHDKRDKKIDELERKLQKFEKSYPVINIAFKDENDADLHVACFNVMCYPDLSSQEIEELTKSVVSRHPIVTDFTPKLLPNVNPNKYSNIFEIIIPDLQRHYEPPSKEEIRKYTEELYPQWVANVKNFFKSLPRQMEIPTREYRFYVHINNDGYTSAENVLVEFSLSGDLFLMPINDKDARTETISPEIPNPPTPPAWRWVNNISLAFSESLSAITRAHMYLSNTRGIGAFDIPSISSFQHQKRDKNAFYWKPIKPSHPTTTWVLECDEFRHKTGEKVFEISIGVPAANQPLNAALECSVSARNLHSPVIGSLPVKISYEKKNSFNAIRSVFCLKI